jgi:zinc protease
VRFTLSNGLPVVLASLHDVPRIDGRLIVNAGDAAAPPAQMGLAVAAAELSIRGYQSNPTAPRPGPAELGGRIWARTDWSTAAIGFASLPRSLEATLVRWTGALRRPLFKERELDLWKRRQLVHRSGVARDAGQTAKEVLVSRLFAASSSRAWPRRGPLPPFERSPSRTCGAFHRERYQPANATLVVTGDIERSALEELLEKYLGDWAVRAPARPPEPPPAEPPAGPRIVVVDMPGLKHAAVQIGTLVPSADSIERAASDVLAGQLAVQIGQATRTAGLVYRPSVSYDGQMGALRLSASVELRRAGELVRLVSAELEKLRRGPQWVDGVMETKLQDSLPPLGVSGRHRGGALGRRYLR